ncbi:ribosomal protein L7/L12 [Nocardioides dilutus]
MGIFGGSAQDQVDFDGLKDRVTKLEAAVAALQLQLAQVSSTAAPAGAVAATPVAGTEWMSEVRRLKESGNVITAIKLYREHTGLGLKEAKDAVEALY